jgi:hypothetical protein
MKRKRFTEEQIIGVLKEAAAGAKTFSQSASAAPGIVDPRRHAKRMSGAKCARMRAMSRFLPSLLFAIYLSLDLSNPMMPGALCFGAQDSVEARQAERVRAGHAGEALAVTGRQDRVAPVGQPATSTRTPAADVRPIWQAYLTRSYPSRSGSVDPSEDA